MGYSIFQDTMADMTWIEVEKAIQQGAIVLLPTGVIEEHGPHLGLATDTYSSWLCSQLTRRHLQAQGIPTLIAPPCYWGVNRATEAFPGSFAVRRETFQALLLDIFASLSAWGVRYVFIINAHADPEHERVLLDAVQEARVTLGLEAYAIVEDFKLELAGLTGQEATLVVTGTPPADGPELESVDIHAGTIETAMMMAYFPAQVNAGAAKELAPTQLSFEDVLTWQQGGSAARHMTPLGYFGAPADYETYLGPVRAYFDALPRMIAETIARFLAGQGWNGPSE
ncbi:MAG: creatininase family protein [Anaerolineae bacterium]|nr:creatininase family protein [Anaerolineae bacterium]